MAIRPALLADLPLILAIERACPTAPHWPEADYRAILEGTTVLARCLFVAVTADGQPVGFAVATSSELESIVVQVTRRNRGLGGQLSRAVIAWAREQGSDELMLEVRASSAGPIRLYRHLGFVEAGRRSGYYQQPEEDAILFSRSLAAAP